LIQIFARRVSVSEPDEVKRWESTDIDALEAEIDEAVYDLFGLDESEREVIEEYLEVF
jgi:hypothetical protein